MTKTVKLSKTGIRIIMRAQRLSAEALFKQGKAYPSIHGTHMYCLYDRSAFNSVNTAHNMLEVVNDPSNAKIYNTKINSSGKRVSDKNKYKTISVEAHCFQDIESTNEISEELFNANSIMLEEV